MGVVMLCQKSLHYSCGMGRRIVVLKLTCSLGHCECDGHTVHKISQRRLTANWLAPRESDFTRMDSKVSSNWLPSYVKAKRPVLEIFRIVEYFPESPRTWRLDRYDVCRWQTHSWTVFTYFDPLSSWACIGVPMAVSATEQTQANKDCSASLYTHFRDTEWNRIHSFVNVTTHALTAYDVQHALVDVRTHIKAFGSNFLPQLADQYLALVREHFHEAVQNLEVEGRCNHLPAGVPFVSW